MGLPTTPANLTVSDMEKSEKYLGLRRLAERIPTGARSTFSLSPEIAEKVNRAILTMARGGLSSKIAMVCVGHSCHPPDTRILTSNRGEISIQELKPDIDTLVAWHAPNVCILGFTPNVGSIAAAGRFGYSFTMASRQYTGSLVTITAGGKSHEVTHDHISVARWNREMVHNKFAVYLMRRGSHFRVGKSQLFYKCETYAFGPSQRSRQENADAVWLLGIYESNTEALLAEEKHSIYFQSPQTTFLTAPELQKKTKWSAFCVQLDEHPCHDKPLSFYRERLASLGLDIECPIWSSNPNPNLTQLLGVTCHLRLHACNIVPGYMSVPIIPDIPVVKHRHLCTSWEQVQIGRRSYSGLVYSLEVEKYHTYFANRIATHNCIYSASCPLVQENIVENVIGAPCPIEESLIEIWKDAYVDALDINPENKIEMDRVNELIESDIVDMRTSGMLSLGQMIDDQPIGFDRHGEVISRRELGVAVQAKMQFKERKDRIVKEFMATREMRAKYRLSRNVDPSTYTSNLLQQASKFARDIEEAEFRIEDEQAIDNSTDTSS